MPYALKFYIYPFCWLVLIFVSIHRYVAPHGLAVVLVFALVMTTVAIYFGRWLFGRKGL